MSGVADPYGPGAGSGALSIAIAPTTILAGTALLMLQFTTLVGTLAALVFLICGCVLLVQRLGLTIAAVQAEIWFLALALWCLASVAWSPVPMSTLRFSILLLFTFLVGMILAYRLAPLSFLKAVFFSHLIAGLLSIAIGVDRSDGLGFLGIYGSKNAMASMASIFVLAALALLLDRSLKKRQRLLAMLALLLATVLLVRAQSLGALVTVTATVIVMLILPFLRHAPALLRLLLGGLAVLAVGLASVVVFTNFDALAYWFVETTGKDLTFTGRTDLWAVAFEEIAKRPLTGTGFQGFWVHGNPRAEELWEMFGIATRMGFHFHNVLISNAVELGLPMALAQVGFVLWASVVSIRWAIARPCAETLFFAGFMIRQIVLSLSEVTFFLQFDLPSIITVAIIVYARRLTRSQQIWQDRPAQA